MIYYIKTSAVEKKKSREIGDLCDSISNNQVGLTDLFTYK